MTLWSLVWKGCRDQFIPHPLLVWFKTVKKYCCLLLLFCHFPKKKMYIIIWTCHSVLCDLWRKKLFLIAPPKPLPLAYTPYLMFSCSAQMRSSYLLWSVLGSSLYTCWCCTIFTVLWETPCQMSVFVDFWIKHELNCSWIPGLSCPTATAPDVSFFL